MFHSFAFDFSVWEVWGAFLTGASLTIVSRADAQNPTGFIQLLIEDQVTILSQVPSVFKHVLAAAERQGRFPTSIRYIVFGGEPLNTHVVSALWTLSGAQVPTVINMFGITEATVHSTYKFLDSLDLLNTGVSPIGQPLPGTTISLRNHFGEEVPHGEVGEIWLSGPGIALGYLNRDDLTAAAFDVVDGIRRYRTGDRAKRRSDGGYDYVGRADRQVKRRGFRIELNEIEAAILEIPTVLGVGVTTTIDELSGEHRIAAFVETHDLSLNDAAVAESLMRNLPQYMQPDSVKTLASLPRLPSGKVDKSALLELFEEPSLESPLGYGQSVPWPNAGPRNVIEARIADIWEFLLGTSNIPPNRDFFELGGHSLLMMEMLSRVAVALHVEIDPARFLFKPTLDGLANEVRSGTPEAEAMVSLIAGNEDHDYPLFCVHPANGRILFLRSLRKNGIRRKLYGVRARGLARGESVATSIEEMATDYVAEIRRIQPKGPYLLAGYCVGGFVAYEMARQLRCSGEDVAGLIVFDTQVLANDTLPSPEEAELDRLDEWRRSLSGVGVRLSENRTWEDLLVDAQRAGALPMDMDVADLRQHEEVLYQIQRSAFRYASDLPAYSGDIYYLAAVEDMDQEITTGWEDHVDGRVEIVRMVCDHFEMFAKPEMAGILDDVLEEILPGSSPH
jgi:nonribosomal peptide synthetase DhbF